VNKDGQRRSIRLPSYDYAQTGAYFVTICTRNRQCFFEKVPIRAIAERCWLAIPDHIPLVTLDEWVVMPNHIHGIIVIADQYHGLRRGIDAESHESHRRGVQLNAPTAKNNDRNANRDLGNRHSLISPRRDTLPVIVRTYKAAVTTFCRRAGYADFQWQRSYYERVIRDDAELSRVRQYISDNPTHWNQDEHHAR
jgi:putative transposase